MGVVKTSTERLYETMTSNTSTFVTILLKKTLNIIRRSHALMLWLFSSSNCWLGDKKAPESQLWRAVPAVWHCYSTSQSRGTLPEREEERRSKRIRRKSARERGPLISMWPSNNHLVQCRRRWHSNDVMLCRFILLVTAKALNLSVRPQSIHQFSLQNI